MAALLPSPFPVTPSLNNNMRHRFRADRLRLEQLRLMSFEHAVLAKSISHVSSASAKALATADSPERLNEIRQNRDLAINKLEGIRREFSSAVKERTKEGLERIEIESRMGTPIGSARTSPTRTPMRVATPSPMATPMRASTPVSRSTSSHTPLRVHWEEQFSRTANPELQRTPLYPVSESTQNGRVLPRRNLTSSLHRQASMLQQAREEAPQSTRKPYAAYVEDE